MRYAVVAREDGELAIVECEDEGSACFELGVIAIFRYAPDAVQFIASYN